MLRDIWAVGRTMRARAVSPRPTPHRKMSKPKLVVDNSEPTAEELRSYTIGAGLAHSRSIVRLVSRGEVKFAIWGPGEEIHGTATALALSKHVEDVSHFGMVPHYRSGALCSMWCELNGRETFSLDVLRQQFSKDTDTMSRGRQMVYHLVMDDVGILPVQSPVGMQLGKAAGYAMGFKLKDIDDGITVGIIGDGTSAEGDLHDAMNAASVWKLPTMFMVTDNGVAISQPDEGRYRGLQGIRRGVRHAALQLRWSGLLGCLHDDV